AQQDGRRDGQLCRSRNRRDRCNNRSPHNCGQHQRRILSKDRQSIVASAVTGNCRRRYSCGDGCRYCKRWQNFGRHAARRHSHDGADYDSECRPLDIGRRYRTKPHLAFTAESIIRNPDYSGFLLLANRAGLNFSGTFVIDEDNAVFRNITVCQRKGGRNSPFGKKFFTSTERDRENHKEHLIDHIIFKQCLGQVAAADDLKISLPDALSFLISSVFLRNTELLQSDLSNVVLTQYLVTSMMPGHISACWGQYLEKISNVV